MARSVLRITTFEMTQQNQGWIKLHRRISESSFYQNSQAVHLWLECLLRASHEERDFYAKREKVHLDPGQFLAGIREIGDKIGVSPSTVHFWLERFELEQMIGRRKTAKGSVITILKWNDYQDLGQEVGQGKNREKTGSEPNKNVKNEKNEKKDSLSENLSLATCVAQVAVGVAEVSSKPEEILRYFEACAGVQLRSRPGRLTKIKSRLGKFSEDEIRAAVENYTKSEFMIKGGFSKNPDALFRSDDQIDKWLSRQQKHFTVKQYESGNISF